jgi:predicted nuclease of predicted toxin-antitoxin system
MNYLCDECIDKSFVKYLREHSLNIKYIREISRGIKDIDIVKLGLKEKRVIITNDKDFGEIVFRLNFKTYGMILLRFKDNEDYYQYVNNILIKYNEKFINSFTTIKFNKIRIRHLI